MDRFTAWGENRNSFLFNYNMKLIKKNRSGKCMTTKTVGRNNISHEIQKNKEYCFANYILLTEDFFL